MSSLARYAIVVIVVGAMTILSYWFRSRSKPRALVNGGGRIGPSRKAVGMCVAVGLLSSAAGCALIWYGAVAFGSISAVTGLGLVLLAAPLLSHRYDVIWSDAGIEGPCRNICGFLGSARARIRWNEIALKGRTLSGYSFVETFDRRRIYWNNYYSGFTFFEGRLRLHRPDLFGEGADRRPSGTTTRGNIGPRNANPARPVIERHEAPAPDDDG